MISSTIYSAFFFLVFACNFGIISMDPHFPLNPILFRSLDENENGQGNRCDPPPKNDTFGYSNCCMENYFAGKIWNICFDLDNFLGEKLGLKVKVNEKIKLDKVVDLDGFGAPVPAPICYTFSSPNLQTHCIKFRQDRIDDAPFLCLDFFAINFLYPKNQEIREIGCLKYREK